MGSETRYGRGDTQQLTGEELERIINTGHELRGTKFKGPGSLSDGRLVAQVVKAVLGMSNRQHGGRVIVGIRDDGQTLEPVGITGEQLRTWTFDAIADQFARYADPGVTFEIEVVEHDGASYVVLEVEEFTDIPVLCKRAYDDVLRDGACYVRTRRKPETSELPTQADMRDLLDLAIEKGINRYIEQLRRIGLLAGLRELPPVSDEDLLDNQLGVIDN